MYFGSNAEYFVVVYGACDHGRVDDDMLGGFSDVTSAAVESRRCLPGPSAECSHWIHSAASGVVMTTECVM